MDQFIRELSRLLDRDAGRPYRWGGVRGHSRAWDLLSLAAALVGLSWLLRRPVPVRIRTQRRRPF